MYLKKKTGIVYHNLFCIYMSKLFHQMDVEHELMNVITTPLNNTCTTYTLRQVPCKNQSS